MRVSNPVILLIGKTGAGKSTLGNLLLAKPHNDGPFYASADMESVTNECSAATTSINGVTYDIIDTPGIFDTQKATDEILTRIAKSVNKCDHGVKAILIVFEAKRFTNEQKNTLNGIRTFLGKDATNHLIAVFSHANREQTERSDKMQNSWNEPVKSFIQNIGNRWSVSPHPDMFSPGDPAYDARLREIKGLISDIQGVYTTEQLERNIREQEEARRKKEEEERRKKQEYEEKLKENAKREAEEQHRRTIELMQQEQKREREERERREREGMAKGERKDERR